MKKNRLSLAVFAVTTLLSPIQAMADITLGIFPRRPVADTHESFKPLAEYLSKKLGEKVQLVVPKDFQSFWSGVQNKKFDLVHFNQYHYIKSHKEFGYKVIAGNEEFGKRDITGALYVRNDSGINSVKDLKGKTILFGGGKKAMGSYIAPTAVLKKAGLVEGKDYTAKFAKNPPGAVIGVYNKVADVAGSGNVILRIKSVTSKIDASQMKILAESDAFTHLAWAVSPNLSGAKVDKIAKAMTGLKGNGDGEVVLKAAKVTNFFSVNDKDFAKVREITEYALGEKY